MERVSIFACESHPIVLEGLHRIFERTEDLVLVGSASSWSAAAASLSMLQPAVVLLDSAGGYRQAVLHVGELRLLSKESAAVLWVNELNESDLVRAIQTGARGLIRRNQSAEVLCDCLRSVGGGALWLEPEMARFWDVHSRRGTSALTPREREIVSLVAAGMKNREIAETLGISSGTVKVHLMHIFEKTGIKDRFTLALESARVLGDLTVPPLGSRSA